MSNQTGIVATVLLGPGSEATVGDAIKSCTHQVDAFLFIESGGGGNAAETALTAVEGTGKAVHLRHMAWPNDYGKAREHCLELARDLGYEWAVTLDPDERLHICGLRDALASDPECDVWVATFQGPDGYHKPRAIRLTNPEIHWWGLAHEELHAPQYQRALSGHFDELEKTPADFLERARRGVETMAKMTELEPKKARWWRHMGECYLSLQKPEKALEAFSTMAEVATNRLEQGWAEYRVIYLGIATGKYWTDTARGFVATSILMFPEFLREFGWLACHLAQLRGEWDQAADWARIVLATPIPRSRLCGHQCPAAIQGCKDWLAQYDRVLKEALEKRKGST